jgi:DNA-binding transcriptional LysR family regulator
MDLWQLKIFCKVVELKSFSKAGEAVHLSQPTVSSHIKELETHFGTQLVDRLARNILPTRAGELLYTYAQRMICLRRETETAMAHFLGKVKGRLVIGGSTIPAGYLLPRLIGAFSQTYPGVQLALIVGDTSDILSRIVDGQIEVGIVGALGDHRQLQQTGLLEDDLRLVVPVNHKWAGMHAVSIKQMMTEPFIVRERGSGTLRAIEQQLRQKGYRLDDLNIVAEFGSTEAVRQGIKAGIGLSILSAIAIAEDEKQGRLHGLSIEGLELKRNFYLAHHQQRTPSPLCLSFIDFLLAEFSPVANANSQF